MAKTHLTNLNIKMTAIAEGAAGDHTVTGITTDDTLLAVVGCKLALAEGTPNTITITAANLTSEFSIKSANTITNSGGTSLADTMTFCLWLDKDA